MNSFWESLFSGVVSDVTGSAYMVIRMLIACLCGACIGLERSKRQKDAGVRTHIIVSLGSALMMLVSKYGFFDILQYNGLSADASRVAANVITGVGFLGAGMIFIRNASIKGLTTAAGIWTTSGVGMAIGAGMYTVGIFATVLMIVLQIILHTWFSRLENTENEFTVVLKNAPDSVKNFLKILTDHSLYIENSKLTLNTDASITLDITVKKSRVFAMDELLLLAQKDENVLSIEV